MTYPRLRKRYRHGAWRSCVIRTLLVVLALVCTIRWSNRLLQDTSSSERRQLEEEDAYYPGSFLDLWPDDKNTEQYRRSFRDCFPEYYYDKKHDTKREHVCPMKLQKDKVQGQPSIQRVALVRSPGRIGDVFVEFVTRVVQLHNDNKKDATTIELVPVVGHRHGRDLFDSNHYSMIIRLATLPVGLEAVDVALTLLPRDAETPPQNLGIMDTGAGDVNPTISMDDLMDLMRYEIRWQCQINKMVSDNDMPLLTITLDRFMGFPSITTRQLQKFLNLVPFQKPKQNRFDMEDLPVIVMDLVNAGSAFVEEVARREANEADAQSFMVKTVEAMKQLVEEEVAASLNDNHPCLPLPSLEDHLLERRFRDLTQ